MNHEPEVELGDSDLQTLEALILDNVDLSLLEQKISQFNIFEALGVVHQEIRHSNFLRWLLDPGETHGLGAHFLMDFLVHALSRGRQLGMKVMSPVQVYALDLQGTQLEREVENTDILVVNDAAKIVVVIENKIRAREHGNQLCRYAKKIEGRFPGYERVFIFLSAEPPSNLDCQYIPIGYEEVASLVERLLSQRGELLPMRFVSL